MGLPIDREDFDDADFEHFRERLGHGLAALESLLARPGFGAGPASIGAELEMCLVDADARPLPRNVEVLGAVEDPRLTVELNRFNLEYDSDPVPMAGRPFAALGDQLRAAIRKVAGAAAGVGGRVAAIGILPTLHTEDVQRHAMTDVPRYRALSAALRRLRQGSFEVVIDGEDPLGITCDDVTFEGATTSLQVHLRVPPERFADFYNAAQIATAPVLALAGNSPLFLGHRLWEETRVALFKQAVDHRNDDAEAWRPARVAFGHGWVRSGVLELFAETAALHPPLIPIVGDEDARACVAAGGVPALDELRLHHGTVWRWNRAVYDPADGGHVRVELRSLPAGPSVVDMEANMAFHVGLVFGLAEEVSWMTTALPFEYAERNFYRAAQRGGDAMLLWPSRRPPSPQPVRAAALARALLPAARAGLLRAGVAEDEVERLLAIVEARAGSGRTGAGWQRRTLSLLEEDRSREVALAGLLERYLEHAGCDRPVHTWPVEP